ncbi:hypothetical protein, partial [Paenibacillus sp. 598K]|uniref:hypothetical protein n=1 Tax=Paenibacillus sp. 598K TaxID=1117987 RepID=UPI0016232877
MNKEAQTDKVAAKKRAARQTSRRGGISGRLKAIVLVAVCVVLFYSLRAQWFQQERFEIVEASAIRLAESSG